MDRCCFAAVLSCALAPLPSLHAQLVPLTQERYLRAAAEVTVQPEDSHSDIHRIDAMDFGPFTESLMAHASLPGPVGSASASTSSAICPDAILFTASGLTSGQTVLPNHTAGGSAASVLSVTFRLANEQAWRLDASMDRQFTTPSMLMYLFTEPPGEMPVFSMDLRDGSISQQFLLAAGDYRLYIEHGVASGIFGGPGETHASAIGNVEFRLVPTPAGLPILLAAAVLVGGRVRRGCGSACGVFTVRRTGAR